MLGNQESLLTRLSSASYSEVPALTATQASIDQAVTTFSHEITNWRNIAAMSVGSATFSFARVGLEGLGLARIIGTPLAGLANRTLALGAEVTAFRGTTNLLQNPTSAEQAVFHRQGWASSFIDFALLKGAGRVFEGQNIILTHLGQSGSMVAGHQLGYSLGLATQPEGSLFEQLAHAEVTNLAMGFGNSIFGMATGNRMQAIERALHLQSHASERHIESSSSGNVFDLSHAYATTAGTIHFEAPSQESTTSNQAQLLFRVPGADAFSKARGAIASIIGRTRNRRLPADHTPIPPEVENPTGPSLPTMAPTSSARSVNEVVERNWSNGVALNTLASLRLMLSRLRNSSEGVWTQFRDHARELIRGQQEMIAIRTLIENERRSPDKTPLYNAGRHYFESLQKFVGNNHNAVGQTLLFIERLSQIRSYENFASLSTEAREQIILEAGIDPIQILAMGRNTESFSQSHLESVFERETLRDLPESREMLQASREYFRRIDDLCKLLEHPDLVASNIHSSKDITLEQVSVRAETIPALRAFLDQISLSEISSSTLIRDVIEQYRLNQINQLNAAMRSFLADPIRAQLFALESVGYAHALNALQLMNPGKLAELLQSTPNPSGSHTEQVQRVITLGTQLEALRQPHSLIGRGLNGVLQFLRLRPNPEVIQGKFDQSVIAWVNSISHSQRLSILRTYTSSLNTHDLQRAQNAAKEYHEARSHFSRAERESYEAPLSEEGRAMLPERYRSSEIFTLEELIHAYQRDHDRQLYGYYENGIYHPGHLYRDFEVQRDHLLDQLNRVKNHLGKNAIQEKDASNIRKSQIGIETSLAQLSEQVRSCCDGLKINRTVESTLQFLDRFRKTLQKIEKAHSIPSLSLEPVTLLTAVVSDKFNSSWLDGLGEWAASPHLFNSIPQILSMNARTRRREAASAIDDIFAVHWPIQMSRDTGSDFVVDPLDRYTALLENIVIAGAHRSWFDFLIPGTPAAIAALIRHGYSYHHAVRIAAKADLNEKMAENGRVGRFFGDIVKRLTINVPSQPEAYRRAVRALGQS
ncbi:MAG: hypothetical protein JNK65_09370, partial [Deltaproteobacteria bacterium]|nr:hypothetical protein [Deltaproteobacteria bacterium]